MKTGPLLPAIVLGLLIAQGLSLAAAPQPQAPPGETKLLWAAPCSFAYPGNKPFEESIRPHVCDYILTHQPQARVLFGKMALATQKSFLKTEAANAKDALLKYEADKKALLGATKLPPKDESKPASDALLRNLKEDRTRVEREGAEIAAPFLANREPYLKDILARTKELDARIADVEKRLGIKHEEQAKRLESRFESKEGGKTASGLKDLGKTVGGKDADKKKSLDKAFSGDTRGHKDSNPPRASGKKGLPQLQNSSATGRMGSADQYSSYQKGRIRQGDVAAPEGASKKTPSAKGPGFRERAAKGMKNKGLEWNGAADKTGENGWEGAKKFGLKAGGMTLLVTGHVTENAPKYAKSVSDYGKKSADRIVNKGEGLEVAKEAAIGTGRFVKNAAVGVWDDAKGVYKNWKEFGTTHTTTYQGLVATAGTLGIASNFVAPGGGTAAKVAVTAGAKSAVKAVAMDGVKATAKSAVKIAARETAEEGLESAGKTALRQAGKTAAREAAEEGAEAAAKRTVKAGVAKTVSEGTTSAAETAGRKAAPKPMMMAAVERADDVAADTRQVTKQVAAQTQAGSKWFEKGAIREVPAAKPPAGAAESAATLSRLPAKDAKQQYLELAEQSFRESDPAKKKALQEMREAKFLDYKTAELRETPEFRRIQDLNVPPEDKKRLVQELVETQVNPSMTGKTGSISKGLLADIPEKAPAKTGIADLAEAQILEGRLNQTKAGGGALAAKQDISAAYRETLNSPKSYKHVNEEMWASAAKTGEEGAEYVETGGGQFMRQQTRGSCPYHATCNLFQEDIAAGRLRTKEVLGEAYKYNPHFASRSAEKGINGNGLQPHQLRELAQTTAEKVGKTSVPVSPEDLVRYMEAEKKPVMVMINTGNGGHVMNVGKPFTMPGPNNTKKVVFQTFDGNNPTGTNGYIDAETLGRLMKGDAVAVVDKGHPLAAKAAVPDVLDAVPDSGAPVASLYDRILRPTPQVNREIEFLQKQGKVSELGLGKAIAQRAAELGDLAQKRRLESTRFPSGSAQHQRLVKEAAELDARCRELTPYSSAAFVAR